MLETVNDIASYLGAFDDDAKVLVCLPGRKEYQITTILECEPDENEEGATVMIMCY